VVGESADHCTRGACVPRDESPIVLVVALVLVLGFREAFEDDDEEEEDDDG